MIESGTDEKWGRSPTQVRWSCDCHVMSRDSLCTPDVLVPGSRKRKGRVARTAPIKRQRTESRGSVGRRGGGEGVRQGRGRGGGGEGVRQGRGRGGGGEGVRQGRGRGGSGEGVRQGRGRGEGVRQGRGRGEKVRVRGKFASKKKGGWSATSGKTRTRKNRNR